MREVNFSIPNANKASVGITTALYDRRALDCTSTLPLINSLNNLAYLTTSSARIRDILTVDGGVERLVCILKEGRSKEPMEMWKWNLAFQCIVNIGVRGSEAVRTRVVEANMVPVVATILDNYIQVVEKCRERAEAEARRSQFSDPYATGSDQAKSSRSSRLASGSGHRSERSRRHAPPPIEIPAGRSTPVEEVSQNGDATPTALPTISLSSPPERTTFSRQRQQLYSDHASRGQFSSPMVGSNRQQNGLQMDSAPFNGTGSGFGIRPVRDVDRLPSMIPTMHAELASQPESPTTPSAPMPSSPRNIASRRRRPSIRHQLSISGNWDDDQNDESPPETSDTAETSPEPTVGTQTDVIMRDIVDEESMLDGTTTPVAVTVPNVNVADSDAFNLTRPSHDGSLTNTTTTPTQAQPNLQNPLQALPPVNMVNATPPNIQQTLNTYQARLPSDRLGSASLLAALPRDEDVIMSLQLLAYVSKYCNLRSFFQATHLVPRLKVGPELKMLDPDYDPAVHPMPTQEELDEQWDNEYVPSEDKKTYNIFPLIEKFTVRCSSSRGHALQATSPQQGETMQYWAGVVMRNLCRKDESRGGIRQCAYWQCGKWEEYTRQFAKCRRCRRTKYCSKECQKGAWGSHRFWCVAAEEGKEGESSERGHRHHHHHRHGHSHRETGESARVAGEGRA
ncbi:hypothetical protein M8818_000495 [Zalaria obscura]|uniref:Uncharacterized protein n=1 Tax=Zalaria obscura TaxID=2024903 RepID=A0ACC3SN31_9PEZI